MNPIQGQRVLVKSLTYTDRSMSRVIEIEQAVEQLDAGELAEFRRWFAEYDARIWNAKFKADVAAGKLDELASKALTSYRRGKTPPR